MRIVGAFLFPDFCLSLLCTPTTGNPGASPKGCLLYTSPAIPPICGRCTDPASSQWLVYGTARPITRVWPLQLQRPYPAYPDLGATNKPHRVSQQGESATNKRDIWQSPSMCFLHCLRFCQKQRRRRHCRCQERRPHRITTWEKPWTDFRETAIS